MDGGIKRLYRSREDSRIAGLCGGIGTYFNLDPVLVRLSWIAITLITGIVPGLVVYVAGWLLVSREPLPVAGRERRTDESPA